MSSVRFRWKVRSIILWVLFAAIGLAAVQECRARLERSRKIQEIESPVYFYLVENCMRHDAYNSFSDSDLFDRAEIEAKKKYKKRLSLHPNPGSFFRLVRAEHKAGVWSRSIDPSTITPMGRRALILRAYLSGIIGAGEPLSWDPLWLLLVLPTIVIGLLIALAIRRRLRKALRTRAGPGVEKAGWSPSSILGGTDANQSVASGER